MREALGGRVAGAMAVRPVVVARQQHERVADLRELLLALAEPVVAARSLSRRDVADVHDEGEVLAVQVLDQPVEARHLLLGIRRVAHQREAHIARDARLRGARGQPGERGEEKRERGFQDRGFSPKHGIHRLCRAPPHCGRQLTGEQT